MVEVNEVLKTPSKGPRSIRPGRNMVKLSSKDAYPYVLSTIQSTKSVSWDENHTCPRSSTIYFSSIEVAWPIRTIFWVDLILSNSLEVTAIPSETSGIGPFGSRRHIKPVVFNIQEAFLYGFCWQHTILFRKFGHRWKENPKSWVLLKFFHATLQSCEWWMNQNSYLS